MSAAVSGHIDAVTTQNYTILPGQTDAGLIIICDHASNHIPVEYGNLGLRGADLTRHIAYDIGAAKLTTFLSKGLRAPALLTRYSRLLIDPNRGEDDPTLIMRLSDGAVVPGNRHVDNGERLRRITEYHRPYHDAIDATIDRCLASGTIPVLLSIHSFTENWKDVPRPWHASVLWDKDPRLASPLLDALRREGDLIVGDNEPYRGDLEGDTMWKHGTMRGIAHAIVEVRQDLIANSAGQAAWSERLLRIMKTILAVPANRAAFQHVNIPTARDSVSRHILKTEQDVSMDKSLHDQRQSELEAAAFRRLVRHLRERSDVQNIDLMNLAGFCRNCISKWYGEAARDQGTPLSYEEAREIVYGMPYAEWKEKYQTEASDAQKAQFASQNFKDH